MRDEILTSRSKHTQGYHYRDNAGKSLEAVAASLSRVASSCVGGAAISALYIRGFIGKHTGSNSQEYFEVMCALADTLGIEGTRRQKTRAVQKYNNENSYEDVMKLVRKTIKRLPAE